MGFVASDWVWLQGPVLGHQGLGLGCGDRWACPGCGGDLLTPPGYFGAWQEVKGETMSVNEALHAGCDDVLPRPHRK